LNQNQR